MIRIYRVSEEYPAWYTADRRSRTRTPLRRDGMRIVTRRITWRRAKESALADCCRHGIEQFVRLERFLDDAGDS